MRSKALVRHLCAALLLVCALVIGLAGCSSSESQDPYVVYRVRSLFRPVGSAVDSYDEYDIVFYREGSGDDNDFEIVEHQNDIMTGYALEYHFYKDKGWARNDIEDFADETFRAVDSMDFATRSVTSEGDYYCLLVQFTDLDTTKNVQAMVDAEYIKLSDDETEATGRLSAGYFMQSLLFQGGTKLTDEEVSSLDLHI